MHFSYRRKYVHTEVDRRSTPSDRYWTYRSSDKSLARPTPRCILFDDENSSFDASLVIYIYIYICVCVYIYIYIYISP
jgi:hypothetical protein